MTVMKNYPNKSYWSEHKDDDKKTAKVSISHQNIQINSANTRI